MRSRWADRRRLCSRAADATLRGIGWPGPPTQRAGLTQAKYVIVNMFARAVQGATPEAAVAEAEKELKDIYGLA